MGTKLEEVSKRDRLWTLNFVLLMGSCFMLSICYQSIASPLAVMLKFQTGSAIWASLPLTAFTIAALLSRPFVAKLSDNCNRIGVLSIAALMTMIVAGLHTLVFIPVVILVIRIAHGVATSLFTSMGNAQAADTVPPDRFSEGIGYFSLSNTLALALGPALGLTITANGGRSDYRKLFLIAFTFALTAFILSQILYRRPADRIRSKSKLAMEVAGKRSDSELPGTCLGFESGVLLPAAVSCLAVFTQGMNSSFAAIMAHERDLGSAGAFFTVYALSILAVRLFSGRLSDRYGMDTVVVPALLCFIASAVIISLASTQFMLCIGGALTGAGSGILQPEMQVACVHRCSPERSGSAITAYFVSLDVGMGGGALIGGVLVDLSGYTTAYIFFAFCAVAALVLYMLKLSRFRAR